MKEFLFDEESGQGMVEYGLILALISIVAIVVLGYVGKAVKKNFNDVSGALNGETEAAG